MKKKARPIIYQRNYGKTTLTTFRKTRKNNESETAHMGKIQKKNERRQASTC